MSQAEIQAKAAVSKLLQGDEDQLYEQLGIRARALAADPALAGQFEPRVTYDQAAMGVLDDVREFGRRLFRRWNAEAYTLVCGSSGEDEKDREALLHAFGVGEVTVASILAALLVSHLGLAPALAAVIAALVAKRFFRPSFEEFCKIWKEKLPKP